MTSGKIVNLDSTVSRKADIITSDMDGETVMMHIDTGKYYNLGRVGGAIWGMIENPIKVADLIDVLLEQYDVENSRCEEETLTFLNDIYTKGLIELL